MSVESTSNSQSEGSLSTDRLLGLLSAMYEIRFFEDEVQTLFSRGLVRGSTHLCQGQEAVVVGACSVLSSGDTMLCTYRGHGAVLAMGAPPDRAFGEILGRANGLCLGKGGSMHFTDVNRGAYGSFAIVGAHLPVVLGMAVAAQYRANAAVVICFFGDGATNIGSFHESLNLASIWKLPVVFVCENNLYGEYSSVSKTTAVDRLVDRADSYRMPKERLDGNDVLEVLRASDNAVRRARAGNGPTFLEALTYRHKGHSRSDPATYRPKGELEAWLKRDPLVLANDRLVQQGISEELIAQIAAKAKGKIRSALDRALSWPEPALESRLEHVYS